MYLYKILKAPATRWRECNTTKSRRVLAIGSALLSTRPKFGWVIRLSDRCMVSEFLWVFRCLLVVTNVRLTAGYGKF